MDSINWNGEWTWSMERSSGAQIVESSPRFLQEMLK